MKNELLHIGPLTVYGYGLMIACALLAAYFTAEYRGEKQGLPREHIFPMFLCCIFGGFAGAKLLFLITEWKYFVRDPLYYLRTFSDGFVVYGGIISGFLCIFVYCRKQKLSFWQWTDLLMPSVALGQGIGRIGCFLAGCCYGKETSFPFGIVFTDSDFAPNGVRLIPAQLISSVLDFLLCFILLRISSHKNKDGVVTLWYLILYSTGRFFVEFLRGDIERGSVGVISTSQFISILIFAAALILLAAGSRKKSYS